MAYLSCQWAVPIAAGYATGCFTTVNAKRRFDPWEYAKHKPSSEDTWYKLMSAKNVGHNYTTSAVVLLSAEDKYGSAPTRVVC